MILNQHLEVIFKIMKFKNILNENISNIEENNKIKWEKIGKYFVNAEPLILYHGTTESSAKKIDSEGLVYGNLTLSKEYAIKISKIRREGEKPVIFKVNAPVHSIYPIYHGPKYIKTDAFSLVKPIKTVSRIKI